MYLFHYCFIAVAIVYIILYIYLTGLRRFNYFIEFSFSSLLNLYNAMLYMNG